MKLKSSILLILSLIMAFHSLAQSKATVYFIRATGFRGSVLSFKAFIDHGLVCKLNNNEFSIHEVDPGIHTFAVQFYGKKEKANAEQIKITVEGGMTYYIEMIYQGGVIHDNLFCQEVTPESAKRILLPKCTQTNRCF